MWIARYAGQITLTLVAAVATGCAGAPRGIDGVEPVALGAVGPYVAEGRFGEDHWVLGAGDELGREIYMAWLSEEWHAGRIAPPPAEMWGITADVAPM